MENSRRQAWRSGAWILLIIGAQAIRVGTPEISVGWGTQLETQAPGVWLGPVQVSGHCPGIQGTRPAPSGRNRATNLALDVLGVKLKKKKIVAL